VFNNKVHIQVKSAAGEILSDYEDHNDYADDVLVAGGCLSRINLYERAGPWCFLLPDGPKWSEFIFDRKNPWAPYCMTINNSADTDANPLFASRDMALGGAGAQKIGNQWKLFFKWSKLPKDISLKAVGLMGFGGHTDNPRPHGAYANTPTVFNPQTLLVLPQPLFVKGRKDATGASQAPDTLEVSYYIGLVGV